MHTFKRNSTVSREAFFNLNLDGESIQLIENCHRRLDIFLENALPSDGASPPHPDEAHSLYHELDALVKNSPLLRLFEHTFRIREVLIEDLHQHRMGLLKHAYDLSVCLEYFIPSVPEWDNDTGKFSWGPHEIKTIVHKADLQRRVLNGFQVLGWPECMDNPFLKDSGHVPSERLRNAIRRLKNSFVGFASTENGMRIIWFPLADRL